MAHRYAILRDVGSFCSRRSAAALVLSIAACQPVLEDEPSPFAVQEDAFRQTYDNTRITLSGVVLAASGEAIAGATIELGATSEVDAAEATTDDAGRFTFSGIMRRNRVVNVNAPGHRSSVSVARLVVPIEQDGVALQPFVLQPATPDVTRFFFAGDVALGRRFLDPAGEAELDEVPVSNKDALIDTEDPLGGSRSIFSHVEPLLRSVDYPIVNLESPVTDDPSTPHETKQFVFFTLPGSLPALRDVGIKYVSLGNNHMFDYLEKGVADTRRHLDEVGLAYSGAGANAEVAYQPHIEELGGTEYALVSATSIAGAEHPQSYVAEANKGGAADLRDQATMRARIADALASAQVPITQLHSGVEYGQRPNKRPGNWFDSALEAGAPLVIGHHPHVAQGVRAQDGTLVFYSLGNFAFDQARQETMLGLTAIVDMAGSVIQGAFAVPVYLEDYRPRLIGDVLLARELRRLGELSAGEALLYPFGGRGWVHVAGAEPVASDRVVSISASIPEGGMGIVDLRALLQPTESLVEVTLPDGVQMRSGRDLMLHGDFEDYDADGDLLEASRWDHTADSLNVCMRQAYRGAAALCSWRSSTNRTSSILPYRNRIRVLGDAEGTPNKDLSLFGYVRLENAGAISIEARYSASAGSTDFGTEVVFEHPGGDQDWQSFASDLAMPNDVADVASTSGTGHPRAVRVFLEHRPPAIGHGAAMYDDLAIISWDPESLGATPLADTNSVEFLRLVGTPGRYDLEVRFRSLSPAAVNSR